MSKKENTNDSPIILPQKLPKPTLDLANHPGLKDLDWRIGQIEKLLTLPFGWSENWRDKQSYDNRLKYLKDSKKRVIANLKKRYEEELKVWEESNKTV